MRRLVLALNVVGALFGFWWLATHTARTRALDWEFWFAFGYLVLCVCDVWYLVRGKRDAD